MGIFLFADDRCCLDDLSRCGGEGTSIGSMVSSRVFEIIKGRYGDACGLFGRPGGWTTTRGGEAREYLEEIPFCPL
jgi:hypothetical protein